MKKITTLLLAILTAATATAQTEVTASEAKTLYKATSKKRVSVHDPSVVYDSTSGRYYILGTMQGIAYTTDMQNWTSDKLTWQTASSNNAAIEDVFTTPAVTKVKKDGTEVDFPAFNAADWSARGDSDWGYGNLWAPDIIWNPTMKKWCQYLSVNGDSWHSSIVLLTADNITGPYRYQGPVVICGFKDSEHSYKETDLELAIGTQSSLPSRYNVGNNWGKRWPHTIDPCVFYDEEGNLWMAYGSWSGGIWMLQLDENTGLRDYDVTYPSTGGSTDGVTSDPYFGKKVAGGYYVSGEGPYIQHIGDYYYLFVSYGFYSPDGGYEMRVFRSTAPDGPYRDASNRSAIFSSATKNYGAGTDTRGEKLMGAYNGWGFQTEGETAQGHNSVITADGRTYLVYHTKFNDGHPDWGFHAVRVHQLFQNKNGWLVAAPFEYNGESVTSADVAEKELTADGDIPGVYQILVHKYKMDYENMEEVTPVTVTLKADGTVSGTYTGTWSREAGTSYLTLKLGSTTYNGVIYEEQMDGQSIKAITFTAMANSGVNVWGYKMTPKYEVAYMANHISVPASTRKDIDLYGMDYGMDDAAINASVQWTSNMPDIISNYGKYNPNGLADDTNVTLTGRVEAGDYFFQKDYTVKALSETNSVYAYDYKTGMVAHYGFDDADLTNAFDLTQKATLARSSTTALPTLESGDPLRTGQVVHLNFGANAKESYISMPNPLYGKTLDTGATIAFWVKRTDDNLYDGLFSFNNGDARFFMTGNVYLGYNNGAGNWLDINQPGTVQTDYLPVNRWNFVVVTINRNKNTGISIYVNGTAQNTNNIYNGKLNGTDVTAKGGFDYNLIVDLLTASQNLYFGKGSFWGSPDVRLDDIIVYDKVLSYTEELALTAMASRVYDFRTLSPTGIEDIVIEPSVKADNQWYDLQGRRVENPRNGLYIKNGKKIVVR